jgi:hypothetical protein
VREREREKKKEGGGRKRKSYVKEKEEDIREEDPGTFWKPIFFPDLLKKI